MEESVAKLARILKARERSGLEDALDAGDEEQNKWILQSANHNYSATKKRSESMKTKDAARQSMVQQRGSFVQVHGMSDEQDAMAVLGKWTYDCFAHDQQVLLQHSCAMVNLMQFNQMYDVDDGTIHHFMRKMRKGYLENPYHNFRH